MAGDGSHQGGKKVANQEKLKGLGKGGTGVRSLPKKKKKLGGATCNGKEKEGTLLTGKGERQTFLLAWFKHTYWGGRGNKLGGPEKEKLENRDGRKISQKKG